MGRGLDKKGRSKSGPTFSPLFHFMMETPAWRNLTTQERIAYVEVLRRYNGSNNGRIVASVRQVAEGANINKDTAGRCLQRLQDLGFLELVTPGGFSRKNRHASEWRLTAHRCDRTERPGSKSFLKWRPENSEHGPSKSADRSPEAGQRGGEALASVP